MQDRLSKLVAIFDALDFRANRAGGDADAADVFHHCGFDLVARWRETSIRDRTLYK